MLRKALSGPALFPYALALVGLVGLAHTWTDGPVLASSARLAAASGGACMDCQSDTSYCNSNNDFCTADGFGGSQFRQHTNLIYAYLTPNGSEFADTATATNRELCWTTLFYSTPDCTGTQLGIPANPDTQQERRTTECEGDACN